MAQRNQDGFDSVTQYYAHLGAQWKTILRNETIPLVPAVIVVALLGVVTSIINCL